MPPLKQTITRDDVAKKAGVSAGVVSWVMNGTAKEYRISDSTIKKVLKAAETLNYTPSIWGQMLKTRKSDIIGFVSEGLTDFATNQVIRAIESSARERGYSIMLFNIPQTEMVDNRFIERFKLTIADGFIFRSYENDYLKKNVKKMFSGKPFSMIGNVGQSQQLPSVDVDDFLGGKMGYQHLVDCGCDNIGVIAGNTDRDYTKLRIDGCKAIQRKSKTRIQLASAKNESQRGFEFGYKTVLKWNKSNKIPKGIFAIGDSIAMGVFRAMYELKLHCPDDIKVVGYDGTDLAHMSSPSLTTIQQPYGEQGRILVDTVVDALEEKSTKPSPKVLSPELLK
ncbi:MAG: LacI family DNA-binding transcriptional regulator, partial [Lentisphaeria bacterium]|nr:LacI family transcriptional regulator [Lentisphaeria bacterium]NQZ69872.1 LacI family DNA-binding transcriptional regulator [Lentisphaeria bacterium]